MQAFKFKTVIDETHTLSLVLPSTVRPGTADVTVVLEMDEPRKTAGTSESPTDELLERLMRFGDGRRLGGLSIKELAAEGRR